MSTLIVVAVTPGEVAPPLSAPAGHGMTHSGAYTNDTLMRLVAGSQSGADSAAGVPIPAVAGAAVACAAAVLVPAAGAFERVAVAPPDPVAPAAPDAAPGTAGAGVWAAAGASACRS